MKGISKIALGIFSVGLVSSSIAAVSVPTGWYLEGNVGQSVLNNKSYGGGTTADKTGFGWNANGGFKFMPFFAMEVGYTHYATTDIKNVNGVQASEDKHYSYDIAGKGILPISDSGVELFAKLGLARLKSHVVTTNNSAASLITNYDPGTHTATGLYMGLGGGYDFTPNIFAGLQWSRARGNSDTGYLDLYSFALSYTFC